MRYNLMKSYKKLGRKFAGTWGRTAKGSKKIGNKGVRKQAKQYLKEL